jgi:cyanophycinase
MTRVSRRTAALVILLASVGFTSCINTGVERQGQLVIVGGGLRTENAEVLGAFIHGAGARVIVLPTASGVPKESGPETVEDFRLYAATNQSIEVVDIEAETPERAHDPEFVHLVESASSAWFTGGVQSRILAVFRPDGADSPAYLAVRSMLDRDGTVGGSSAGAAMMCDPMIAWGNSREALLCGVRGDVEDRAVRIEQGMGFFPYGLVDQHFLRRGRIGRLVVALEHTGRRFGFGIAENSALAVDLGANRGRALGDRAVVMVDTGSARRDGLSHLGLRVSLLSSGDAVDLERGRVVVESRKRAVEELPPDSRGEYDALGPWDRSALGILMERLSRDPRQPQQAIGDVFTMVLRADSRTRFLARDSELADFTVVDAILDIVAGEHAAQVAEELSRELAASGAGD